VTAPAPQYTYRARLVRPTDGDTCVLILDLGCHVAITRVVRLLGVNTPEVIGASATAGKAAQAWTAAWLAAATGADWPLVVTTTLDRDDKYGRLLGRVWRVTDGACLNDDLLAASKAVAWDGKGARPGG
jgi:endonuclease YncB( thermonuclease family)